MTRPPTTAPGVGTIRRSLYVGLGLVCVGLGTVGAFVPGLPTTVFLIAASYLFARSSPALQRRLTEHPVLGPYLRRFAEERSMPARAKAVSLFLMWAGIALSVLLAGASPTFAATMGSLGLVGTGVILFYVRTAPVPATPRPD